MVENNLGTIDYFETFYSLGEHSWGASVSELAIEAAAVLKTTDTNRTPHILDLGCGDGRDAMFFAAQGWHVTAVDQSDEALKTLASKAKELGVEARIKIKHGDISRMPFDGQYDLIFSNYCFHYLEPSQRQATLTRLMECTKPNGFHAIMAMRDLNEEVVGSIDNYRYLRSGELAELYDSWNHWDVYDGFCPDEHPGAKPHEHSVSIIIAQKPHEKAKPGLGRWRGLFKSIVLALGIVALSVLLCTLGYSSLNSVSGSIANVWPGAIFQVVSAAALGGWGVVATIISAIITNAINVKTMYAILAFIPANFVQSFIPAYYYRRILKKGGWSSRTFRFLPFLIYGVLIPNILGSFLGGAAVHMFAGAPYVHVCAKWFIANVPIAIILGWPLFRYVIPALVDEGWTVKGWWR
jgi:tellurite methyltransferase